MVTAIFSQSDSGFYALTISGHADFAGAGSDIVCAAVSSAVNLVCNTITEVFKLPAQVGEKNNCVTLKLPQSSEKSALLLLQGLYEQLLQIEEEYPANLRVQTSKQENVTGGK